LTEADEWIVKQSMEEKSSLQENLNSGSRIKRVDNALVEVIEPVTAESEEEQRISSVILHESLPGNGTHFSGSLPLDINSSRGGRHQFICEKCGQEIDCMGPQSRQEHDDYHLALDLDLQEQESDRHAQSSQVHDNHCLTSSLSSQQRVSANSTTQPLVHPSPGGKRKISNCSSKKRRIQNSTLDCFVYRSKRQRTFVDQM
jgi:transcription elongation factor Elf1